MLPRVTAAESGLVDSSISPVAIFATMTAPPITSAGRFSPLGPRGILELAFVDFHAVDIFHPNVAVALIVKVLPISPGFLDRV
jgi:hypothetical protein